MPSLNGLISVDDHVLEPPHVWTEYLPGRLKERAPAIKPVDGVDSWVFEGKVIPTPGLGAVAGKAKEEFSPEHLSYSEMRAGCYDSVARLADMDQAGVLASLNFPSFPRFCGQIFNEIDDKGDLGLECVKAYNNWMLDEWCGSAPGRYIPLILIPLWDPGAAAQELDRCGAKGARAFAFSENPIPLGLPNIDDPSRYWDPVLAAAAANEMVVCMHVGSSSQIPKVSPHASFLPSLAWGAGSRTSGTMLCWLFSGVFETWPGLRICLSEGNVGWIPYFIERAEQVVDKQRFWIQRGVEFHVEEGQRTVDRGHQAGIDLSTFDVRQSYHDHVYGCMLDDVTGINNIDVIGVDNVMFEMDYPHSDSTWPAALDLAKDRLAHLPEETQYKLLRGNAERLFQFTPTEPSPVAS
jgi:predicted TIM-barrel fold metal-dependent hydrolase